MSDVNPTEERPPMLDEGTRSQGSMKVEEETTEEKKRRKERERKSAYRARLSAEKKSLSDGADAGSVQACPTPSGVDAAGRNADVKADDDSMEIDDGQAAKDGDGRREDAVASSSGQAAPAVPQASLPPRNVPPSTSTGAERRPIGPADVAAFLEQLKERMERKKNGVPPTMAGMMSSLQRGVVDPSTSTTTSSASPATLQPLPAVQPSTPARAEHAAKESPEEEKKRMAAYLAAKAAYLMRKAAFQAAVQATEAQRKKHVKHDRPKLTIPQPFAPGTPASLHPLPSVRPTSLATPPLLRPIPIARSSTPIIPAAENETSEERRRRCEKERKAAYRARLSQEKKGELLAKEREAYRRKRVIGAISDVLRNDEVEEPSQDQRGVAVAIPEAVPEPPPIRPIQEYRTTDQRKDIAMSLVTLHFLRSQAPRCPDLQQLLTPYNKLPLDHWILAHRTLERFMQRRGRGARVGTRRLLVRNEARAMTKVLACWNAVNACQELRYMRKSTTNRREPLHVLVKRAQKVCADGRTILGVIKTQLGTLCDQLAKQVDGRVYHPQGTTKAEKVVRTIGRVRYHKSTRGATDAVPLSSIYPDLYREFMGLSPIATTDQIDNSADGYSWPERRQTQSEIQEEVEAVMEELIKVVITISDGILANGEDDTMEEQESTPRDGRQAEGREAEGLLAARQREYGVEGRRARPSLAFPPRPLPRATRRMPQWDDGMEGGKLMNSQEAKEADAREEARQRGVPDGSNLTLGRRVESDDEDEMEGEEAIREEREEMVNMDDMDDAVSDVAGLDVATNDLMNEDPEVREAMGQAPVQLLARVTYARACVDGLCPSLTTANAYNIKRVCTQFIDLVRFERFDVALVHFAKYGEPLLDRFGPCFTGVRSIRARVYEIKACVNALLHVERGLRGGSTLIPSAILGRDWLWLPARVQKAVEPLFIRTDETAKHSQAVTEQKFGQRLAVFARHMEPLELYVCDVCHRFTMPDKITRNSAYDFSDHARPRANGRRPEFPAVCATCIAQGRKSGDRANPATPRYSHRNSIGFDTVPPELQGLNWVMKTIIARVHAVRSIVCLQDKGGRDTAMRATRGCMALVPVPTEPTIEYVAETLPSDAHLSILVNAREIGQQKLICLPQTIAALKWFKRHNGHYAHIIINDRFRFSANAVILQRGRGIDPADATDAQLQSLNTVDPSDLSLLRHMEEQPVRPLHAHVARETAYEQYALKKNPYNAISNQTKNLDELVLPWHFPRGRGGYSQQRGVKVTLRHFLRWALATADRRIASDMNALAFYHGLLEQLDLMGVMAMQVRLSRGLTNAVLDGLLAEGDVATQAALHSSAKAMRGHVAYWNDVKRQVRAHIAVYGPPTWFITLNPGDKEWEGVMSTYTTVYGPQVTPANIFLFIARDPFFYARYFHRRVRRFFSDVILKPDGPLGNIVHHFFRVEYQARGREHVHCLLWAADAPAIDAPDSAKLEYISAHVTARLPDQATEPELYDLVDKHQRHWPSHSKTCLRKIRIKGRTKEHCRFGFPKKECPVAIVNHAAADMYRLPGSCPKVYMLARTKDEIFVNDYCPGILLGWGANVVVDYTTAYTTKNERGKEGGRIQEALRLAVTGKERFAVLSDMLRLRDCGALEIVDFIMGHSLHSFDSGHVYVNTNSMDKRDRMLKSTAQRSKESSTASPYRENLYDNYYPGRADAMEDLCLLHVAVYYTAVAGKEGAPRRAVSATRQVADAEDDDDDDEEEANGDVVRLSSSNNSFHGTFHIDCPFSPFYDNPRVPSGTSFAIRGVQGKVLKKKYRPEVPRFFWPHLEVSNLKSREDYFRRLVMLFCPWREEETLFIDEEGTDFGDHESRWNAFIDDMENSEEAEKRRGAEDIRRLIAHQEALIRQDRETMEKRKERWEILAAAGIDDDPSDALEVYDREVDPEAHAAAIEQMNTEQLNLYEEVVDIIAQQAEYDEKEKAIAADSTLSHDEKRRQVDALGGRPPPLRRTVIGNAGCGKSFLINNIADELTLLYTSDSTRATKPAILLTAPTGLAARQINGSTIHSALGIEVQHGKEAVMKPLGKAMLQKKKAQFANLRLMVIDELSMVSNVILGKIHARLQEIMSSRALFGGVNLLILGDLMQLPPVLAQPIYKPLSSNQIGRVFGGCLPSLDIFGQFSYAELTVNMRQRGDTTYADLLARMRLQHMDPADFDLLRTRIIPSVVGVREEDIYKVAAAHFIQLQKDDPRAMALFGHNEDVDKFNKEVMELRGLDVIRIMAEDSTRRQRPNQDGTTRDEPAFERVYQRAEFDISRPPGGKSKKKKKTAANAGRAAGLEYDLQLAIGARVMLRRNVQPSLGLVNGSTGVLLEAIPPSDPVVMKVDFDNLGVHSIEKVSATFDVGAEDQISRRQFPLCTAFACTIHRVQGLTLDTALISTPHLFCPGMAFVAFSRLRTLDGLHLMDLHPHKFTASGQALAVYSELRKGIHLPAIAPLKPLPSLSVPTKKASAPPTRIQPPRMATTPATQRIHVIPPPQPGAVPAKKRKADDQGPQGVRNDQAAIPITDKLSLVNRSMDCFAIAAVNLIHSLLPIRLLIISHAAELAGIFPLAGHIADVLSGEERSVRQLRIDTNMEPDNGEMDQGGCADAFLDSLEQEFPTEGHNVWHVDIQSRLRCRNGHEKSINGSIYDSKLFIRSFWLNEGTSRGTLESLFHEQALNQSVGCDQCAENHCHVSSVLTMRGRYLRFVIDRHQYVRGAERQRQTRPLGITGANGEAVTIFGIRMRPVALVQHLTEEGGWRGHYVTWVKEQEQRGWVVINDSVAHRERAVPPLLNNVHMIVFEKI